MTQALETIEEMRRINASFPYTDPVRNWKKEGKKVIGWTCINVPEEIIHAAGMLPYRVTGYPEETVFKQADTYLYTSTCSFVRSCLEMELQGEYDFLDGYVGSTPCEGVIRLAEIGERYSKIPHLFVLDVPRKMVDRSVDFYREEVEEFKQRLERHFEIKISDEALTRSIEIYNETRASLRKLNGLRKQDRPPVSGAEMMEVLNVAVRIPREEFNLLLKKLFAEIEATNRAIPERLRLMISGSVLNSSAFIQGIEDLGVTVVADDVCTGSRYWWEAVEVGADPMAALAKRYLNMSCPCPRMNPPADRVQWIQDLVKEFRADGLIALTMRNCAPYIHDLPLWKGKLEESGTPVLDLDIEYGSGLTGQIRIRVEAFMEMLTLREEWE